MRTDVTKGSSHSHTANFGMSQHMFKSNLNNHSLYYYTHIRKYTEQSFRHETTTIKQIHNKFKQDWTRTPKTQKSNTRQRGQRAFN